VDPAQIASIADAAVGVDSGEYLAYGYFFLRNAG